MDQPWGLSGPQFLALYVIGFMSALVVMFVVQTALTRVGSRRGADDLRLDAYQAAYLAGGYRRLVDTAIAALASRGQILVSRNGQLTIVSGASGHGPVEAAVCTVLHGTTSRSRVHKRMRYDPAVLTIDEQMRSRGLLLNGMRALWWRLMLLVPVAVLAVGLVRAVNGAQLHRPVSTLVTLLFISLIVLVFVLRPRFPVRERLSPVGRAAVRQLRKQHRAWSRNNRQPASTAHWDMIGVAVLGFSAIGDPTLRHALTSSSSSAGSGSSGGGGGCGGGGCGG